jgi:two-component system, chemotaxis family, protein-glutamate methylesterase/glutaminase
MILFCEECGTRHDIPSEQFKDNLYQFSCDGCQETLVVSLVDRKAGKSIQAAMQKNTPAQQDAVERRNLKVLVVDDSKMIRRALCDIIASDGNMQVVGEAGNGQEALDVLRKIDPDVITLDINMPVMDGLTCLKHIMIHHPTPTVMISALTKEGALETFDSLKYGAIDFLPKPSRVKGGDLKSQQAEILRKIELVASVQIESIRYLCRPNREKNQPEQNQSAPQYVLAFGVAEGGYGALLNVIPRLRADLPAAYIAVMYQAAHHIDGFARYLNRCSELDIQRATDGTLLQAGRCYLAAATEYVTLVNDNHQQRLQVNPSPFPTRSGAINSLMASVAQTMNEKAVGIILTGAGEDGIEGLGKIIHAGGVAFVQDPKSALFKQTPMAAATLYAVEYLVSDKQMASAINSFLTSRAR